MNQNLTQFQAQLVLSRFPAGTEIVEARYFQSEYLPAPVRVTVQTPGGARCVVVLRLVRHADGSLHNEARLLPILAGAGLPVPQVLVEPTADPHRPDAPMAAVYSLLPGQNCQVLSEQSPTGSRQAMELVLQAVEMLAGATEIVRRSGEAPPLPERTLQEELRRTVAQGGAWLQEAPVLRAIERLQPVVAQVDAPLVFTNGDYQPANFLSNGETITGIVDFEYAHYGDLLLGFAKYPIYDLHPLNKAGMIAFLRQRRGITAATFALRVAIGCLQTLQREIPVQGGDGGYRNHVLNLLADSLETIDHGL